jgi:hypothetical protein
MMPGVTRLGLSPMWDVLAIAPTDDPKAIRRAYAARLKQMNPDRDREAFARLRHALEWALTYAGRPRRAPPRPGSARDSLAGDATPLMQLEAALGLQPDDEIDLLDVISVESTDWLPPPASHPAEKIPEERADERALLIGLESALRRGDARAAWQLYVRAAATGAVPLGDSERMLARLFTAALDDPTFDGAAFRELAKGFGWDRPELRSEVASDVRQRVSARLAAEDWYDALVATADRRRWWFGRRKSRVPRLVLRRVRGRGLLRIDRQALRATLDALKPHHVWLRDRISPEWVAALERRVRRRDLIAGAVCAAFVAFLALDVAWAVIGSALGLTEDRPVLVMLAAIALAVFLIWGLWAVAKHFIGMWRSAS